MRRMLIGTLCLAAIAGCIYPQGGGGGAPLPPTSPASLASANPSWLPLPTLTLMPSEPPSVVVAPTIAPIPAMTLPPIPTPDLSPAINLSPAATIALDPVSLPSSSGSVIDLPLTPLDAPAPTAPPLDQPITIWFSPSPLPTPTSTPLPSPTATPIASATVNVADTGFSPATLNLATGATVAWIFQGTQAHSTTSDQGFWDSGLLGAGLVYTLQFNTPGTYAYHDTANPAATGAIVVR